MGNCLQIKCLISKGKGSDTKKKTQKTKTNFIFLKGKNISANSKGISKKIIIGHNG